METSDSVELLRKKGFAVKGRVIDASGGGCKEVLVYIHLQDAKGRHQVGALKTDEKGDYAGEVTIPSTMPLGEYTVVAQTPGTSGCGQGATE
jgi:protocatechuate 3,4-dioxygenase beta subunit